MNTSMSVKIRLDGRWEIRNFHIIKILFFKFQFILQSLLEMKYSTPMKFCTFRNTTKLLHNSKEKPALKKGLLRHWSNYDLP